MRSGFCVSIILMFTLALPLYADTSNPVAHWPLDGNADDVSGNNLHGVLVNGPTWSSSGVYAGCISLDGINDYVRIPDYKGITGTAARTCAFWIRTTSTRADILGWGRLFDDNQQAVTGQKWQIVFYNGEIGVLVQGGNAFCAVPEVNNGQWHHVAVVLDDANDDGILNINETQFYIDGLPRTQSRTVPFAMNTAAYNDVHFGAYPEGTTYFLDGSFDDVRIYDRAIDQSEVLRLYNYNGFDGGSGTPDDPYQISTPEELMSIRSNPTLLTKHYILTNDIIFDPDNNPSHSFHQAVIAPYESSSSPAFSGSFDGKGHSIVNLKIVGNGNNYIGLFGQLTGTDTQQVIVRNLTLVNPATSGGLGNCSALAAKIYGCKVQSCDVIGGVVSHPEYGIVGALVGELSYAVIEGCSSSANVIGKYTTGGLVGDMSDSSLVNCSASGNVSNFSFPAGGLVGQLGVWSGGSNPNELISEGDRIINCFATGTVSSESSRCGGLVGYAKGECIEGCYATGNVYGVDYVGGLVGYNTSPIIRCFSTGFVQGNEFVGGLTGTDSDTHLSFWDTDTSQIAESGGGTGKTTSEMMSPETFRGWGDDVWVLDAGYDYPHLAWEETLGEPIVDERTYGGSGTAEDPFRIGTVDDLIDIGWNCEDWDKHFILTDDIVLDPANLTDPNVIYDNANFNKIGVNGLPFSGHLNGNFHTISNLTTLNYDSYNGLFGFIQGDGPEDTVVENLLLDSSVLKGYFAVGGLVGWLDNARIVRCGVEGISLLYYFNEEPELYGYNYNYYGGLAGRVEYATVSMCYVNDGNFEIEQSYQSRQGGLIGFAVVATIENSYAAAGFNTRTNTTAGFTGGASYSEITNCYAVPTYTGSYGNFINGFTDQTDVTNLNNCYYQTGYHISSGYGGIGLTDEQMKQQANFVAWDFVGESTNGINEIWRMCVDGVDYPRLSWEFARNGDFACGDGVDMLDFEALIQNWLAAVDTDPATFNYACDANGDERIDLADYAVLGANW